MLVFDDTLREIIHHLKYADRVSLAGPCGELMKASLDREPFTGDLIIPVPLHPQRERERGFNQAELLARRLGREVDRKVLRRKKNTRSQTGLSRAQRNENLRGAFEVRRPVRDTVIVVDDVYTTGSTVNEVAKVLKHAGASRVEVLTLARVAEDLTAKARRARTEAPDPSVSPVPPW